MDDSEKGYFPRRAYLAQFDIRDGVVTKYSGEGGDVVIPDGVTAIGRETFRYCLKLKEVTIKSDKVSFESLYSYEPFSLCSSLRFVTMPKVLAGGIFKSNLDKIFGVQRRNIRFTFTK